METEKPSLHAVKVGMLLRLTSWLDAMMNAIWGVSLTVASISPVYY